MLQGEKTVVGEVCGISVSKDAEYPALFPPYAFPVVQTSSPLPQMPQMPLRLWGCTRCSEYAFQPAPPGTFHIASYQVHDFFAIQGYL